MPFVSVAQESQSIVCKSKGRCVSEVHAGRAVSETKEMRNEFTSDHEEELKDQQAFGCQCSIPLIQALLFLPQEVREGRRDNTKRDLHEMRHEHSKRDTP